MKRRVLTNADIAELLAREAEKASRFVQKALRRAARLAFLWPDEAAVILQQGRSLTELPGVGPYLERIIRTWLNESREALEPEPIRAHFLTLSQAQLILAAKPRWKSKLRGDLQMHSEWSDGSGTIREMAEQGIARDYEYIAITDHSKGLKIAGGINESELKEQSHEIEEANRALEDRGEKLRVLHSIEMNLNPSGKGDMDSGALARLDLVLGSFHSSLRGKGDQTERYIAALNNPDIQILGHPRGRIFNYREGLNADWPHVFAEAAILDKAVEIDCYPDRQDLSTALLKYARQAGVRISIGTDAHSPEQLGFIDLGLAAALVVKIPPERILNFMPRNQLLAWVASVRVASASSGSLEGIQCFNASRSSTAKTPQRASRRAPDQRRQGSPP